MINGVPRILIIRLSAIGDVVRVLPALHALRDQYPTAQIDWVVEQKSASVLEDHPALDRVWIFERSKHRRESARLFRKLLGEIRRERYDIVVDFHGIFKSGLILLWSGAKEKYGFARPRSQEFSWLFSNRGVKLVSNRMNRIEENLELVKALGARRHHLDVEIDVAPEVEEQVHEYVHSQFDGAKTKVGVHVPVDRPEKQWPLASFAALCDMLLGDGRFDVILTYGPGQHHIAEAVQRMSHRKPDLAPSMPDLKHYAALASELDLFFGGDTGPMHIASAMGTPVVAVFGGTDPQMHGPYRQPHIVLYAGEKGPGKAIDRRHGPELMAKVSPEAAYDACVQLIYGVKRAHAWMVGAEDERVGGGG